MPGLELEVRRCADGILIYEGASRSTHLLNTAAWELFLAIANGKAAVVDHDASDRQLLEALAAAGLLSRC